MAMRPFIYAAENADLGEGDKTEVQVLETALESTAEQSEIQAETAAIDTEFDEANAGLQAADDIQAVVEVASDSLENGEGLNEQAAEMAVVAIESAMLRLTGTKRQRIVMAVESFGSSNSRVAATESIVQGGIDMIKRVWQNIKDFAKRVWDRIKQLFARVVNSSKLNAKNLENLRKRVNDLDPSAEMDSKELKNESLAKKISVKKKADLSSFRAVVDNSQKLISFGKALTSNRAEMAAEMSSCFALVAADKHVEASNKLEALSTKMEGILKAASVPELTGAEAKFKRDGAPKGQTTVAYGPFVGGSALTLTVTPSDGGKADSTGKVHKSYSIAFETIPDEAAKEVAALDRGAMLEVIKIAETSNDSISEAKGVFDGIEKINATIAKTIDDLMKQVEKHYTSGAGNLPDGSGGAKTKQEAGRIMRTLQQDTKDTISMMNSIGNKVTGIQNDVVNAGIDYVNASLKNFKVKK